MSLDERVSNFYPEFAGPSDWAAMYRSSGLQIIPSYLPSEAGKGQSWKRPKLAEWAELQEGLVPDASFERWYGFNGEHAKRTNMGILTGRASGNIFVIDLDDQKGSSASIWWQSVLDEHNHGVEPETWQQRTGGGGRQILFRARPDWHAPTNRTPINVDIRGQGGFAVMPPSQHESGNRYDWLPGAAPYEIDIEDAPEWLLGAVDQLVAQHGGDKGGGQRKAERTVAPQNDFDAFGGRVDGREDYMTRVVWGAVVDMRRDCPIPPTEREQKERATAAYEVYERSVKSRLSGTEKREGLEREGRGHTEFWRKWRNAMRQWDTHVAVEARQPRPGGEWKAGPIDFAAEYKAAQEQATEAAKETPASALFEYLDIKQIKTLPDPKFLVKGLVIENSLGFIYGPPGCLKTFISLDMALSFAAGVVEWWGRPIERQGAVIYISSEGQSDFKFRIRAWELKNRIDVDDSPFFLIRQTINFMKPEDVGKLLATVDAIKAKLGDTEIVAVFVDTVSRTLPGADENLQKDMTLFIAACDAVREKFGATVFGVHHTSRAGNMRGSTVFAGAGDFLIEVDREEGAKHGSIRAAKIKAAEDGWEQAFKVEEIPLGDIGGHSSLVVEATNPEHQEKPDTDWPSRDTCKAILTAVDAAWTNGKPWSSYAQTQKDGRYAPDKIAGQFSVDFAIAEKMVRKWLAMDILAVEEIDTNKKLKGLRVAQWL